MKQVNVNLPPQGKVILIAPKAKVKNGQLDLFERLRESWLEMILGHINTFDTGVRMSEIRQYIAQRGLSAPIHPNWWGIVTRKMRHYGWRISGYDKSPIKSRRGGVEAIWAR